MYVHQLMDLRLIHADGSQSDITPRHGDDLGRRNRGHMLQELRTRSVLDLPDVLTEVVCSAQQIRTDIAWNGSMAVGSTPEVRVYIGRIAGTEGPHDDGIVCVATLLRVDR